MTTNVLPQQSYVNRTPWARLEQDSRNFVKSNNADLYIFAGGAGYNLSRVDPDSPPSTYPFDHPDLLPGAVRNLVRTEQDENGQTVYSRDEFGRLLTTPSNQSEWVVNPKQIGVPDYLWKIIVPLHLGQGSTDINGNTQIISVIMPNVDTRKFRNNQVVLPSGQILDLSQNQGRWTTYAVSVRDIEALTGYNFFSSLPQDLQDEIEQRVNTSFQLSSQTQRASLLAESSTFEFSQHPLVQFPSTFHKLTIGQNEPLSHDITWLEADGPRKVNVPHLSLRQESEVQINTPQATIFNDREWQLSPLQISTIEVNSVETSFVQGRTFQVNPSPASIDTVGSSQTRSYQTSSFQLNAVKEGILQNNSVQTNSSQINIAQINLPETSLSSSVTLQQLFSSHHFDLQNTTIPSWTSFLQRQTPFNLNLAVTDLGDVLDMGIREVKQPAQTRSD